MGAFDPVHWSAVETALGPPAETVTDHVDRLADEVGDMPPYAAVKHIHDAIDAAAEPRRVPSVGEPFITAYLLERDGVIDPDGTYPSLLDRRPSADRLRTLLWEREWTLWWIGVVCGVHPSLVTFWCYEDDIPLMERNYTAESLAKIDATRDDE